MFLLRRRTGKTLLIMGIVYFAIIAVGIALLYAFVPTAVWQTIWNVYGGGDPEAVG